MRGSGIEVKTLTHKSKGRVRVCVMEDWETEKGNEEAIEGSEMFRELQKFKTVAAPQKCFVKSHICFSPLLFLLLYPSVCWKVFIPLFYFSLLLLLSLHWRI
ncbi:uncharacterized protein TEOVI_000750900 [Trypanosoma equiperdum]|uniref:Uncharacterized protein n=2 Tax=Trypanozoon TaxID=39700 RepID=Q4GYC7_TRYB2|nr:hypothetical protein, unlikely [Trypanosoma brucei brucei TREU927]CAJ16657.1 hypothetical protein, unlikely [Trypanosoma brucei brucei TREU927]SCU65531.1 hypothetical protein, conserved [Trypanosoma equiperdum]